MLGQLYWRAVIAARIAGWRVYQAKIRRHPMTGSALDLEREQFLEIEERWKRKRQEIERTRERCA